MGDWGWGGGVGGWVCWGDVEVGVGCAVVGAESDGGFVVCFDDVSERGECLAVEGDAAVDVGDMEGDVVEHGLVSFVWCAGCLLCL